jgi:hypothetical protein
LVEPGAEGDAGAPQSLLQILIRLQRMHDEAAEKRRQQGEELNKVREEQAYWGRWMWVGYYQLKRMAHRPGQAGLSIDALAERLEDDNFRAIEWIGLAARWADLWGRERE